MDASALGHQHAEVPSLLELCLGKFSDIRTFHMVRLVRQLPASLLSRVLGHLVGGELAYLQRQYPGVHVPDGLWCRLCWEQWRDQWDMYRPKQEKMSWRTHYWQVYLQSALQQLPQDAAPASWDTHIVVWAPFLRIRPAPGGGLDAVRAVRRRWQGCWCSVFGKLSATPLSAAEGMAVVSRLAGPHIERLQLRSAPHAPLCIHMDRTHPLSCPGLPWAICWQRMCDISVGWGL